MKIGTLKISDSFTGQRLGEGAIGLALWEWQRSDYDQVYVTVYPKHDFLIRLIEQFGFVYGGEKGEERVYYKDKRNLSYDDSKKSFPYINPEFTRGKYLPINADYHDQMFQYSELDRTYQQDAIMAASNGVTKIYVATPSSSIEYLPGDVVFVYRIHDGERKTFKSVLTSYCTLVECVQFKIGGTESQSFEEFKKYLGNKIVIDDSELIDWYGKRNVYALTLMYNGFFGRGNNIPYFKLNDEGLFYTYPYNVELTKQQVLRIMEMGGKDEEDFIIH